MNNTQRLQHINVLLRSFVSGRGVNSVYDAQEHHGHVIHLTLNHVEPAANPYESLPGLVGLLALCKEDRLHPTNEAVPAVCGRLQI